MSSLNPLTAAKPLGDRYLMNMSSTMKRFNKGVEKLIRMNKYKIGVIFEIASFANVALINSKYLDIYKVKASQPDSLKLWSLLRTCQ